jgi:hypothetical protein
LLSDDLHGEVANGDQREDHRTNARNVAKRSLPNCNSVAVGAYRSSPDLICRVSEGGAHAPASFIRIRHRVLVLDFHSALLGDPLTPRLSAQAEASACKCVLISTESIEPRLREPNLMRAI